MRLRSREDELAIPQTVSCLLTTLQCISTFPPPFHPPLQAGSFQLPTLESLALDYVRDPTRSRPLCISISGNSSK
jgi:hypothetical protein